MISSIKNNKGEERMIYELTKNEFIKVMPLSHYYNIEIPAIITGLNKGKIYADSRTNPKTAMIWTDDGSFFIGDTKNKSFNDSINKYIDTNIAPMAKELGLEWFEICSVSNEWSETIEELFGYRGLDRSNQFVFRMNEINAEKLDLKEVSEDIQLVPISMEVFQRTLGNKAYFVDGILEFWDSLDDFCNKGFGYFLIKDDTILSRCTLDFKYNGVCTLGVATDKNNRKCGYAKRVVSETLKHCMEKELDPYWDCMEVNHGSIALAKSVGFKKDYTYSLYEFKFE